MSCGEASAGPTTTLLQRERDGMLAAIVLTSQVVPSLLAPELLLLAVEDVVYQWRHYLDRWDEAGPAHRPAGAPMRLVKFVDRYCVQVEHGTGLDGCAGRCPPGRAGRGCDPDACAAGAWLAHVTALDRADRDGVVAAHTTVDGSDGRNMSMVDAGEQVGQEVVGYSPDGGFLIRGRRGRGQWVRLGPGHLVEVVMADAVDQRVFGVGADEPVVKACRWPGDGWPPSPGSPTT